MKTGGRTEALGTGKLWGLQGGDPEAWREETSGGSPVQDVPPRPGHVCDLSVPPFLICKMGTDPRTVDTSQDARDSAWCTAGAWH